MGRELNRGRDPFATAAVAVWSALRVGIASVLVIGLFMAVVGAYFVAPYALLGVALVALGGVALLRLLRAVTLRSLLAATGGIAITPLLLLRAAWRSATWPIRAIRAPAVTAVSRLRADGRRSLALATLTAATVAGGVAGEAAGWRAAGGAPIVSSLYWASAGALALGLVLMVSRSLRRGSALEGAVADHIQQLAQAEHSLEEAEERFQTLAATSPDGIAVIDANGDVRLFNEAICELFGYEPAEMERLNLDALVPSDERGRAHALQAAVLAGEQSVVRIDTRRMHRNGQALDVEFSAWPFREDGQSAGLLVEFRDISARKREQSEAERRVLQQSALAEFGVNALTADDLGWLMQEAAALVAATLRVEYCGVMELLTDRDALQLRAEIGLEGEPSGTATQPASEGSQAAYTLAAAGPVAFDDLRTETRFEPMPLLVDHGVTSGVTVAIGGAGQPFGVLGGYTSRRHTFTETDVHFLRAVANVLASAVERDRADRIVRESEQRFRQLIENARNGIGLIDMNGRVLLANAAAWEMLGYGEDEVAEITADPSRMPNVTDFVGAVDAEQIAAVLEARRGGADVAHSFQFQAGRPGGDTRDVDISVSAVKQDDGTPVGVLIEGRDITEELRMEERLLQAQKSEALGTLVSGVAHDFNNLLTVIAGSIEVEQRNVGDSPWLQSAHLAAQRAEGIVRQLLQFSRRGNTSRSPVDLVELTRETVSLASETFDRRIELRLEAPDGLPAVLGDRGQLHQVLMNLLVNARDAVTERLQGEAESAAYRPSIVIAVRLDGGDAGHASPRMLLTIEDNGVGIPREVQERMFDPFFTTKEPGSSEAGGTGLGLSTVYGIVTAHDGTIEARSEPGQGATFALEFPTTTEAPTAANDDEGPPPRAPAGGTSVLLVDDEPGIARFAGDVLNEAGYSVAHASDGDDAVRRVTAEDFDLVLLDVNMPSLNGWQALPRLLSARPGLRVLMMSGWASAEEAVAHGAAGLLDKPFGSDALLRTVGEALQVVPQPR